MRCLHCATENGEAVKFCKGCGTAMAAPAAIPVEEKSMLPCPSCQHENQPSAKFCAKCGSNLSNVPKSATYAAALPSEVGEVDEVEVPATVSAVEANIEINVAPEVAEPIAAAEPIASNASTFVEQATDELPIPRTAGSGIKIAIVLLLVAVLAGAAWWMFQGTTAPTQLATPAITASDKVAEPKAATAIVVPERAPALAAPIVPESAASSTSHSSTASSSDADQNNLRIPPSAEELKAQKAQLQLKKEAAEQARIKKSQALREAHQARAQERANAQRSAPVLPAAGVASRADQIMACKRLSFFEKEKCIWGLCHDQWGKNGCPSYD